ncbi:MAG: cytochrome c family protein [Sphingobium sp.]
MRPALFAPWAALLAMAAFPAAASAAGDAAKGKTVFARCMACHKVDKSGANGLGPNLYGIVGRPVASVKGFNYSPAMKAKGGKWTPAEIDAYLTAPAKAVPGNRMIFVGLPKKEDRDDLLAYLVAASK